MSPGQPFKTPEKTAPVAGFTSDLKKSLRGQEEWGTGVLYARSRRYVLGESMSQNKLRLPLETTFSGDKVLGVFSGDTGLP